MPEKLAVKALRHSEITIFRPYFEKHPKTRQKAINLDASVFIELFYPTLRSQSNNRYFVDLHVFGPGLADECFLTRKIIKQQKNWRLDGELIDNPPDEPGRFSMMSPGDIAIITFDGVIPEDISLYLLSATNDHDLGLHSALSALIGSGRKNMQEITIPLLRDIIHTVNPEEFHPIRNLLLEDEFVDAAQNGIEGINRLRNIASRRHISHASLRRARENANRIGRIGEEFVNSYLSQKKDSGDVYDFVWTADENAISPYDFQIELDEGPVFIDVKSTMGAFNNQLHISYNELLFMRQSNIYQLYRVYEIEEQRAKLQISTNMHDFAEATLEILEQLPEGVRPDSISVSPHILVFSDMQEIEFDMDDE